MRHLWSQIATAAILTHPETCGDGRLGRPAKAKPSGPEWHESHDVSRKTHRKRAKDSSLRECREAAKDCSPRRMPCGTKSLPWDECRKGSMHSAFCKRPTEIRGGGRIRPPVWKPTRNSSKHCHPERSASVSAANRRTQSRDLASSETIK